MATMAAALARLLGAQGQEIQDRAVQMHRTAHGAVGRR